MFLKQIDWNSLIRRVGFSDLKMLEVTGNLYYISATQKSQRINNSRNELWILIAHFTEIEVR